MENNPVSVSDAIALFNQTLDYAFPVISVEGEVASFKVNQNKFVFFDIKDETGTLGCFMMVYALRVPLENGMRVQIVAKPTITKWGKFSLTVQAVIPKGEGSIKRAFEALKKKLDSEGLFAAERKRALPRIPATIGVISSPQAAGYADFIKIITARWPAVRIVVAPAAVQGIQAPTQVSAALKSLNERANAPDVITILRGGGSADDLAAFNDEGLVRAVAASKIPVVAAIGHENDETLIDYAADVRASTPSNAAELLVPDKTAVSEMFMRRLSYVRRQQEDSVQRTSELVEQLIVSAQREVTLALASTNELFVRTIQLLEEYNPERVLRRGYAIIKDSGGRVIKRADPGDSITIRTEEVTMKAEVQHVEQNN